MSFPCVVSIDFARYDKAICAAEARDAAIEARAEELMGEWAPFSIEQIEEATGDFPEATRQALEAAWAAPAGEFEKVFRRAVETYWQQVATQQATSEIDSDPDDEPDAPDDGYYDRH